MKKVIIVMLFLLLCSCSGGAQQNTETKEENINEEIKSSCKLEYKQIENFSCPVLKDAKDVSSQFIISSDGSLYVYDYYKKFSTTETNCKKLDTDIKFENFYENFIISDSQLYSIELDDSYEILNLEVKTSFLSDAETHFYKILEEYPSGKMVDLRYYFTNPTPFFEAKSVINGSKVYAYIDESDLFELHSFDADEEITRLSKGMIQTNKGIYKLSFEHGNYADSKEKYYLEMIETKDNCADLNIINFDYAVSNDKLLLGGEAFESYEMWNFN